MKLIPIVVFVLAGCAVRCDDTSNYFVIEMPPAHELKKELPQKQFQVYWNVPTMQCRSKKIPFENLFEKYGIIQNKNDDFRGDKISILYDPGLFPALLRNESSGKLRFRNGGVPQEGDIQRHMDTFRNVLELSIPDEKFDGVGIIDFESWRPIFRQNFGVLVPYKDVSYEIERKRHTYWLEDWIKSEAKSRFEEASRRFMQTTISIAKQMRPLARWGYYGFPYCFNGNPVTRDGRAMEKCANGVTEENDRTYWLWSESSALYPSVYSSESLETYQLTAFIRGRVAEAQRVNKRDSEILPYFWFKYRDAGYLTERDLKASLQTFHKTGVAGFIIWGSSNDVNSVTKCNNLLSYLDTTLGPAIAKYTKKVVKLDLEDSEEFNDRDVTTVKPEFSQTTLNSINEKTVRNCSRSINLDPENCWDLPANYAQDIKYDVDEHYDNSQLIANTTGMPKIQPIEEQNRQNDTIEASASDNKFKTENYVINMLKTHRKMEGIQETTTEFTESSSIIINSKYENALFTENDQNVDLSTTENNNENEDPFTTENYNENIDKNIIDIKKQNINTSTTENNIQNVEPSTTDNNNFKIVDDQSSITTEKTATNPTTEKENVTSTEVFSSIKESAFTDTAINENESQTTQILMTESTESSNTYNHTSKQVDKNVENTDETTTDLTFFFSTTTNLKHESRAYNANDEQNVEFLSTTENNYFKITDDVSTTLTMESNDYTKHKTIDEELHTTQHPMRASTKTPNNNNNKSTRIKKKLKAMEENNETLDSNDIAKSSVIASTNDQVTIK